MRKPLLNNVDLLDTMEKILNLNTIDFRSDFKYDVELLVNSFEKQGSQGKFIWTCADSSTHLLQERNMFICRNATQQTFKSANENSSHTLSFLIEPEYADNGTIMGRMTGLDYREYFAICGMEAQDIQNVMVRFRDRAEPMIFSYDEFDSHYQSIYSRYGPMEIIELLVGEENQLMKSMTMARGRAFGDAEIMRVEDYLEELAIQKAEDYKDIPQYFLRFEEEKEEDFDR